MTAYEAAPTPDEARVPDEVLRPILRSWDEQTCQGKHHGCDPDCPDDRPMQALRLAWRAVHADNVARTALLAALGHTDCVPREEHDRVDDEEWMARVRSGEQARRAERAEQRLRTIHGLAYGALPEASGEPLDGGDGDG